MDKDENLGLELARSVAAEAVREIEKERSFAWELITNARNDARRWFIISMAVLIFWFASTAGFIWYLAQYDFISQDGSGYNNVISGESGDIYNGPAGETQEK